MSDDDDWNRFDVLRANYSWLKGTKCKPLQQFGPGSTSDRIASFFNVDLVVGLKACDPLSSSSVVHYTHARTHTHRVSLSLHTYTLSLSLSHTHTRTHARTLAHPHKRTHARARAPSVSVRAHTSHLLRFCFVTDVHVLIDQQRQGRCVVDVYNNIIIIQLCIKSLRAKQKTTLRHSFYTSDKLCQHVFCQATKDN